MAVDPGLRGTPPHPHRPPNLHGAGPMPWASSEHSHRRVVECLTWELRAPVVSASAEEQKVQGPVTQPSVSLASLTILCCSKQ